MADSAGEHAGQDRLEQHGKHDLDSRVGRECGEELPERVDCLLSGRRPAEIQIELMEGVELLPRDEGAADSVDGLDNGGKTEGRDGIAPDQGEGTAQDVADAQWTERDAA